jgi:CHAD domain-containing protein
MNLQVRNTTAFPSPVALFTERWKKQGKVLRGRLGQWDPKSSSEEIHQIRVTSRKARASCRVFAQVFPQGRDKSLERDLKRITKSFSPLRSWDVGQSLLEELEKEERRRGGSPLKFLLKGFRKRRKRLRKKLKGKANTPPSFYSLWDRLTDSLAAEVTEPQFRASLVREDNKLKKKVIKSWSRFQNSSDLEDLHQTRILLKKWRYHQEILQDCLGLPSKSLLEAFKRRQDQLGGLNDWVTLQEQLQHPQVQKGIKKKKHKKAYRELVEDLDDRIQHDLREIHDQGEQWLKPLLGGF